MITVSVHEVTRSGRNCTRTTITVVRRWRQSAPSSTVRPSR